MRLKASVFALLVATCYAALAQSPQQNPPRDDAYISQYQPAVKLTGDDVPIKDDPRGRIEWMRELMGGALTPEFMEAMMKAADEQIAQYGPAGRGGNPGAGWRQLDQYRTFSIELDSERAPGPGVRYGTHPDLPGSPHEPRCALRPDVERRPVEDDQLQSPAALVAGDDRHDPQHVGRQRGTRKESRDHLSGHGRPVRSRRRRIRAPVDRRRPDVVSRDQARRVDGRPRRESGHELARPTSC